MPGHPAPRPRTREGSERQAGRRPPLPRPPLRETCDRDRPRPRMAAPPIAPARAHRRERSRARGADQGSCATPITICGCGMEAGPQYLEGTTDGSGRDIIGVRRDRIADIISTGREIIVRAKSEKLLPETITGATAALLVTIAGYGEPLSEGQWRELAGVVGGIMRDSTYADLARLRTLITQEQFLNVARNQGYGRFIRRLDDGRWVCELAPKLEDLPDE